MSKKKEISLSFSSFSYSSLLKPIVKKILVTNILHKPDKISYLIAIFVTIVRYYDYSLFGLSAFIIADNFMPGENNVDKLLNFFILFGISVTARPIGSIVFGHISDKVGRVVLVKITTIISILSVISIAVLPSYRTLGYLSPIVLMLSRMTFIMSLAGEVDAIKVYVAEKIGTQSRHLASSIISFSAQLGVLVAACMYYFTTSFSEIAWLWRINFFIGGIFGLLVYFLRESISESDYYIRSKFKKSNQYELSLLEILSQNKSKFLLSLLLNGTVGSSYNFIIIFLNTFVTDILGIVSSYNAALNNITLIMVYAISCLFSGFLADRVSAYKQIFISLILAMCLVFIMQLLIIHNIFSFPVHLALVFIVPIYMIPIQVKLQSLFSVNVRVRMSGLSHSLGSMFLSSTMPFICMFLWKLTKNSYIVYLYFMIILILITCLVFIIMKASYQNMFNA